MNILTLQNTCVVEIIFIRFQHCRTIYYIQYLQRAGVIMSFCS